MNSKKRSLALSTGQRPPRVALVHDWLTGMRGGERVLERIAELYPQAPIFTLFHIHGSLSPALEQRSIRTSFVQRLPLLKRYYRYYLPLFPRAIETFDLSSFDLVISTSHCVAKSARPPTGVPHLCYCHTPMRYAWDQEDIYFQGRGPLAALRRAVLARLRRWDRATANRASRFVANSTFVAERISSYYGRRADVLAPPVDVEFYTPEAKPNQQKSPYLLAVAALAPYKRLDLAIAAARRTGLRLIIVGTGPEQGRIERLASADSGADNAAAPGQIELRGRVSGEELRSLYRGALAFVQPGVEDFGIAAAEALACGTPVVACDLGGVRDIVESGRHGVLYAPESGVEGLVAAVDKVRQKRFNTLDLRTQAEGFAEPRFQARIEELVADVVSDVEAAPLQGGAPLTT